MSTPAAAPWPVQFLLQFAGPLIKNYLMTTAERTAFLTSPLRYPGQPVWDTDLGRYYLLNQDKTDWVDVFAQGGASGVLWDEQGALSGRDAYDSEAEDFKYLDNVNGNIYVRFTATAGTWVGPFPYARGNDGVDGTDGLDPHLRRSGNLVQWKYTTQGDGSWITLFDIGDLAGEDGETPLIQLSQDGLRVEYKYPSDAGFTELFPLSLVQGAPGPAGAPFTINAYGPLAERVDYNNEPEGFVFLDTTGGDIYIMSDQPGTWSAPLPWKGDAGDTTEFRVFNNRHLQSKLVSQSSGAWTNIFDLHTLRGANGETPQFRLSPDNQRLETKLPSQSTWTSVFALSLVKGDKGDKFSIDAQGSLATRSGFDAQPAGFTYYATDTGEVYIRLGVAGWSQGFVWRGPAGKGAYDSWKEQPGNENGTVADFILSLKGTNGISITKADIVGSNLIITFSDNSTYNAGVLPGAPVEPHYDTRNPTASDNYALGFAYNQRWQNTVTDAWFILVADGVWINYSTLTADDLGALAFLDSLSYTQITGLVDVLNTLATKSELQTLTGRVSTVESSLASKANQTDLNQTNTTVAAQGSRLTTAESNIAAQGNRLTTAENDIDALQAENATQGAQITSQGQSILTLNQTVSNQQSEIDAAQQDITDLEAATTALQASDAAQNTAITALDNEKEDKANLGDLAYKDQAATADIANDAVSEPKLSPEVRQKLNNAGSQAFDTGTTPDSKRLVSTNSGTIFLEAKKFNRSVDALELRPTANANYTLKVRWQDFENGTENIAIREGLNRKLLVIVQNNSTFNATITLTNHQIRPNRTAGQPVVQNQNIRTITLNANRQMVLECVVMSVGASATDYLENLTWSVVGDINNLIGDPSVISSILSRLGVNESAITSLQTLITQLQNGKEDKSALRTLAYLNQLTQAVIPVDIILETMLSPALRDKINNQIKRESRNGAPTVNDDSTQGFSVFSEIFDRSTTPTTVYRCYDATTGAAVWEEEGAQDVPLATLNQDGLLSAAHFQLLTQLGSLAFLNEVDFGNLNPSLQELIVGKLGYADTINQGSFPSDTVGISVTQNNALFNYRLDLLHSQDDGKKIDIAGWNVEQFAPFTLRNSIGFITITSFQLQGQDVNIQLPVYNQPATGIATLTYQTLTFKNNSYHQFMVLVDYDDVAGIKRFYWIPITENGKLSLWLPHLKNLEGGLAGQVFKKTGTGLLEGAWQDAAEDINIIVDAALSNTSQNPVENRAVKAALDSLSSTLAQVQALADSKASSVILNGVKINPRSSDRGVVLTIDRQEEKTPTALVGYSINVPSDITYFKRNRDITDADDGEIILTNHLAAGVGGDLLLHNLEEFPVTVNFEHPIFPINQTALILEPGSRYGLQLKNFGSGFRRWHLMEYDNLDNPFVEKAATNYSWRDTPVQTTAILAFEDSRKNFRNKFDIEPTETRSAMKISWENLKTNQSSLVRIYNRKTQPFQIDIDTDANLSMVEGIPSRIKIPASDGNVYGVAITVDFDGTRRVASYLALGFNYDTSNQAFSLATPTLSTTNVDATEISVSWTASPDAAQYELQLRPANGVWATAATVPATTTAYTLDSLDPETAYELRIRAIASGETYTNSGYSDALAVTTDALIPLPAPTNFRTTAVNANSVSLAWNAVPNADEYSIRYRVAPSGGYTQGLSTSGTTITINTLTPETLYDFEVRALPANPAQYDNSSYAVVQATTSAAPVGSGRIFQVNFDRFDHIKPTGSVWNNFNAVDNSPLNASYSSRNSNVKLKDTSDQVSTIDVVFRTASIRAANTGRSTNAHGIPPDALDSYIRCDTDYNVEINGLDNSKTYDIKFFGSRDFVNDHRVRFTVNGQFGVINPGNVNLTPTPNIVTEITGLTPSSGILTIAVSRDATGHTSTERTWSGFYLTERS